MNKKLLLALAVAAALAMLAGCANISDPGVNGPAVNQPVGLGNMPQGTGTQGITTNGAGMVSAKPDNVSVSLGVVSRDKNLNTAQQANTQAMTAVIDALKKIVKEEDITTSSLNVSPMYNYNNPQPVLEGYEISNSVTVHSDDISKAGGIVDAAMAAGANQVYGVSFSLKEDQQAYADALKLAVEDARRKAEVLASASGVKIDGIVSITENGSGSSPVNATMIREAAAAAKDIGSTIQSGSLSVVANVTVVFGYK